MCVLVEGCMGRWLAMDGWVSRQVDGWTGGDVGAHMHGYE